MNITLALTVHTRAPLDLGLVDELFCLLVVSLLFCQYFPVSAAVVGVAFAVDVVVVVVVVPDSFDIILVYNQSTRILVFKHTLMLT